MPLPDSFMQDLKSRNDIVDVVSSYVSLKKRGRNYVGLCPFHNEKTPSFNLYPENGSFFCFGCETGGDVITFIRKIENLDYMEAVRFLAQRAGIAVPETGYDDGLSKIRARILEINRETAKYYHQILVSETGKAGLEYLQKRGLSTRTIRHFGLGYAPSERFALVDHLRSLRYSAEDMIAANVAVRTRSGSAMDRFFDRVMFPIIDLRGNVIAFGGRIMTNEKPKYLNTSDTPVFQKSESLFAMNYAKNHCTDSLILAEGYMDVIALHQAGFQNTVATLGTALTSAQARLMARYTKEVVLCYDSDEAGQRAASRAVPILRGAGLLVKIIAVPGGKDPDEFIRSHPSDGAIRFRKLIESGANDIEYSLSKIRLKNNLQSDAGRVNYLREAIMVLASIDNELERDIYAGRVSSETGAEKTTILAQAKNQRRKDLKKREEKSFQKIENSLSFVRDDHNPQKHEFFRASNAEEDILAFLFANPDQAVAISAILSPDVFCTDFNRRLYKLILERINETVTTSLSLSDFSESLSSQEQSALAGILAKRSDVPLTRHDIEECIGVLQFENQKKKTRNLEDMNSEDFQEYLAMLRKNKA